MFSPLRNAAYRHVFLAQVLALIGTGLATVALGLLAHELAGAGSGEILGIAFAIKMIAYVCVAPFAGAIAAHVPRKTLLVMLDGVRALVALALPFVGQAWQVYALMTVLYMASAAFTPAFQAMIPEVLEDEREYTRALSLSRLASDLESVASPVIAAALLAFVTFNNLFLGTSLGFLASALLVVTATLPARRPTQTKPFLQRLTSGFRIFLLTPRLRGFIAISLATAAGGAMVFVNTVSIVQTDLGLGPQKTAWALAVFGAGSMLAAVVLPRVLESVSDRIAMGLGAAILAAVLVVSSLLPLQYPDLLVRWFVMGAGYSLTLTPGGRVLRRSSSGVDRPALFAANFTLSHACWLIAYPVAGLVSASFGTGWAFAALGALASAGLMAALTLWPSSDPETLAHAHPNLSPDHPHLKDHAPGHQHAFVIDDLHGRWPGKSA